MAHNSQPSSRAPKELFWLDLDPDQDVVLKYRQKGGGKFTSRAAALARQHYLAGQGISSTLFTSGRIAWVPAELPPRKPNHD